MKRGLLVSLIMLFIVSSISMVILLNTVGESNIEKKLVVKAEEELYDRASYVASQCMKDYAYGQSGLQSIFEQLKMVSELTQGRIWIVSASGTIIADTKGVSIQKNVENMYPDMLDKTFIENFYIRGDFTEPMLAVTVPITYQYSVKGYVCMFVTMNSIKNQTYEYMDAVNICYLVFLIVQIAVFGIIYRMTVTPLHKLNRIAKDLANGNFETKIQLHAASEFKDIEAAIKYLSEVLKDREEYQRRFIADISHDFRSPLTSIKGYIEAMKDGTIEYEMQPKYFDILIFETERLRNLTNNLIELNRIDNKGMLLKMSTFDINTMIKRILLTFEGTCKKKKITLNLIFSNKETFVVADSSKIEQVLYNLVDNAIKFSYQESSIKITTEEKGNRVIVSVKDFGTGIPKESLGRIWERFYKVDTSRGKDKKGTGLGLAIVKEIITAHGENISVVSTENVGTEFIFSLPLAEDAI